MSERSLEELRVFMSDTMEDQDEAIRELAGVLQVHRALIKKLSRHVDKLEDENAEYKRRLETLRGVAT